MNLSFRLVSDRSLIGKDAASVHRMRRAEFGRRAAFLPALLMFGREMAVTSARQRDCVVR
jgi:hypothetical protein